MEKPKRAKQAWYVSFSRFAPGYGDSRISSAIIYEHPLLWVKREQKRPGGGIISVLFWEKITPALLKKIKA